MTAEIRQLIEDCLAEKPASMCRLVDHFRGRVFGLCYRMLGQWQDAEDASQETFLRVSRSLTQWDQEREFEPWLLSIAANRCRTQLASRQRQRVLESHVMERAGRSALAAPTPARSVDQLVAVQLLSEEVERALALQPEERAKAFRMFHERAMSYLEISERLKRPVGTIKTWVYRVRLDLITALRRRKVIDS